MVTGGTAGGASWVQGLAATRTGVLTGATLLQLRM